MENLWIPIILATALIQTGRNGLMKDLKGKMRDETIMLSRFLFSMPFILLWFFLLYASGYEIPQMNTTFLTYAGFAAVGQLMAGLLYLKLFGRRNFVIGVTYNQTQVIMNVLFSAILFSQFVSFGAFIAVILSFVGIVLISLAEKHLEPKTLLQRILTPSALMGLGCGVLFGLTGVLFREAILALQGGERLMQASFALVYVTVIQAVIILVIVSVKSRKQLPLMIKHRRQVSWVGLTNAVSSLGWFVAFSMTHSAHVYMVGQVEVIFSLLLSHRVFKEKLYKQELLGMTIVIGSIILLVLSQ